MSIKPFIPDKEFFSIGEVSQITQLPAYVLRYWEGEFKLLRPARRTSGQRKFIKADIEKIFKIKELLHDKKYTISGAKKFLLDQKRKKLQEENQLSFDIGLSKGDLKTLQEIKKDISELVDILEK